MFESYSQYLDEIADDLEIGSSKKLYMKPFHKKMTKEERRISHLNSVKKSREKKKQSQAKENEKSSCI